MKTLPGVDVSNWNGPPGDWRSAAGDVTWAAVKLTELAVNGSRYVNPDAEADWSYARSASLGRVAYFFAHPGASPGDTVSFFLSELDRLGLDGRDGIAMDLETADSRNPAQVSTWARMVTRSLQNALKRPCLIYTFIAFAEAGNCAGLGGCPLWIADPSSPPGKPRVPKPWDSWAVHQYSQDGTDKDLAAFGSLDEMAARLGRATVAEKNFTADGKTSLVQIAAHHGATPAGLLRRTAVHDERYAGNLAAFLNAVFAGTLPPTAPVPAGVVLRVPA